MTKNIKENNKQLREDISEGKKELFRKLEGNREVKKRSKDKKEKNEKKRRRQ